MLRILNFPGLKFKPCVNKTRNPIKKLNCSWEFKNCKKSRAKFLHPVKSGVIKIGSRSFIYLLLMLTSSFFQTLDEGVKYGACQSRTRCRESWEFCTCQVWYISDILLITWFFKSDLFQSLIIAFSEILVFVTLRRHIGNLWQHTSLMALSVSTLPTKDSSSASTTPAVSFFAGIFNNDMGSGLMNAGPDPYALNKVQPQNVHLQSYQNSILQNVQLQNV